MFKKTDKWSGSLQGYVDLVPSQLQELLGDSEMFDLDKYVDHYSLEDDDGHFVRLYTKWSHPSQRSDRSWTYNIGGFSHEDVDALVHWLHSEGLDVENIRLFGVDVSYEMWESAQKAHAAVDAQTVAMSDAELVAEADRLFGGLQ